MASVVGHLLPRIEAASVPVPDLVAAISERRPAVLGISATLTPHIWVVEKMIAAVRAAPACADVIIIVGGRPFALAPAVARAIGADGTAAEASDAVPLAARLLEHRLRG